MVLLLPKGPVEGHTTEILRLEDREKERRMIGGEELYVSRSELELGLSFRTLGLNLGFWFTPSPYAQFLGFW